jgi:predicted RNA-binding protein YlxR (DUF448 family)
MVRIVRTSEGVKVDPSGKHPGRGAYLHELRSCWEAGIQGGLARSLKTNLTTEDIQHLSTYMSSIPEDSITPDKSE